MAGSGWSPQVEFDTTFQGNQFGWLRYFLAPMQDGRFQQGQITHPIGPCVFVFPGSVGASYHGFKHQVETDPKRAVSKGEDFLSRLHGFMDVS